MYLVQKKTTILCNQCARRRGSVLDCVPLRTTFPSTDSVVSLVKDFLCTPPDAAAILLSLISFFHLTTTRPQAYDAVSRVLAAHGAQAAKAAQDRQLAHQQLEQQIATRKATDVSA